MQLPFDTFFRRLFFGTIIVSMWVFSTTLAHSQEVAPATRQKPQKLKAGQEAGFHQVKLGDFEITALHDGFVQIDAKRLKNIDAQELQRLLARKSLKGPKVKTSINTFLVNTGKHIVLVDTGTGNLFGRESGQAVNNLVAAGYKPEQVDAILITHMHGDHIGGLIDTNGKRVFPNAHIYVDKMENDFWLSEKNEHQAPEGKKVYFKMARDVAKLYIDVNKWKNFERNEPIVPGIKAIATPGHTPGHTSYQIESKGQKLLVMGDLAHNCAVQFTHPYVSIDFDSDQKKAVETRYKIFRELATSKDLAAGMHLPFPGMGYVMFAGNNKHVFEPVETHPENEEYEWVPVK